MMNTSTLVRPGFRKRNSEANRFVDVEGVRVRYMEEGSEHPGTPLLIVHGYNGSCDYWYPHTIPTLGLERRVIALDLPGNGLSGKLREHTLASYTKFIVDYIDALGLAKVDLMGHSLGGMIGIAAATNHPERFRKLVLVDSAGLPELVKRPWLVPIKMLGDSSLRQVRYYPTFIKIGMRARTPREGLKMIWTESVGKMLSTITMPTLIMWGSHDRVVPLEHGVYMAQHIPGARLAIIRGTGHMPFYEKPRECNKLVLSFLRSET